MQQQGETAYFSIIGQIDEVGANEWKSRFNSLTFSSFKEVIFDFGKVTHIGSAGLGKLLLFYKTARSNGCELKIVNVTGPIYDLMLDLELDKVFTINR